MNKPDTLKCTVAENEMGFRKFTVVNEGSQEYTMRMDYSEMEELLTMCYTRNEGVAILSKCALTDRVVSISTANMTEQETLDAVRCMALAFPWYKKYIMETKDLEDIYIAS